MWWDRSPIAAAGLHYPASVNSAGTPTLQQALEGGVLLPARQAPALGDRPAFDLADVAGEIDWLGAGDIAAHAEPVDGRAALAKAADPVRGKAAADEDAHMIVAREVELVAKLDDKLRGDAAALTRRIDAHPPQAFPQRLGHSQT